LAVQPVLLVQAAGVLRVLVAPTVTEQMVVLTLVVEVGLHRINHLPQRAAQADPAWSSSNTLQPMLQPFPLV
jgi:hypothetical protein